MKNEKKNTMSTRQKSLDWTAQCSYESMCKNLAALKSGPIKNSAPECANERKRKKKHR